jgi:hypothetical protein
VGYSFRHSLELFEDRKGRVRAKEKNPMMSEEQIQGLVARVIQRLAERLGALGDKGRVVVVFTAASVEFREAIQQVRNLIMDGFRVQLVFSPAAEHLISRPVREQLDIFPYVSMVEPATWLSVLKDARAVVVPLLSLNTLSKLSMVIADNTATNIILHALLMGKPVVIARNGADPADKGREELGFHRGSPALTQAMMRRLQRVADYGCILTDVRKLRDIVNSLLISGADLKRQPEELPSMPLVSRASICKRFVTAAEVLHAWRTGTNLNVGYATRMTPLAQELASRYGVVLMTDQNRSI